MKRKKYFTCNTVRCRPKFIEKYFIRHSAIRTTAYRKLESSPGVDSYTSESNNRTTMNHVSGPAKMKLSDHGSYTQTGMGNEDTRSLRAALVDDEPLARRELRRMLKEIQDVEIVGECSNGEEALALLQAKRPNLIFLDVEMPGINGIDLARRFQEKDDPWIVFVTAHDAYALEAFHVHAMDYLLKPLCEEKVRETIDRISRRRGGPYEQDVRSRLDSITRYIEKQKPEPPHKESSRIPIKKKGRIYFVEISTIDWVQAEGNYAMLHTGTGKHLLRIKMNQLEERLNSDEFYRVHRSTIVHGRAIKELRPYFNGSYLIILTTGEKIISSRGYRKNIEHLLCRFV